MATKKTVDSMVNVANAIRNSSDLLKSLLPRATAENAAQYFKPMLDYTPAANAFLDALVNKIVMQIFRGKMFKNPLANLKKGASPLGAVIEDIHPNPVVGTAYDPTATTLLTQAPPDVAAAYYTLNRQDRYDLTVSRRDKELAFTSWEAVDRMTTDLVNSLYSGNYIDEFRLMVSAFQGALANDAICVSEITRPTDESTGKAMLAKMRALNRKFQLPSTEYNAFKQIDTDNRPARKTWTNPEDILVITTADTEALLNIEVMAAAFHVDLVKFVAEQCIIIDTFGENSPIQAVIFDRAFMQVWDNLFLAEPFHNPQTLADTYYLHAWQTYGVCPFANAVALVSSTGTYTLTTEQPADWAANYTSYYTKAGTVYPVYTAVPAGTAAPEWAANKYYSKS